MCANMYHFVFSGEKIMKADYFKANVLKFHSPNSLNSSIATYIGYISYKMYHFLCCG